MADRFILLLFDSYCNRRWQRSLIFLEVLDTVVVLLIFCNNILCDKFKKMIN